MAIPALPLELQLYIIELAAPLHEMTRRRETLKCCSLVHRSWTSKAQQLLFQHLKHAFQTKMYWQFSRESRRFVEDDDDRLGQRLRAAPVNRNGHPGSFGAASVRIPELQSHAQHAALKSIAHTISSLCVHWVLLWVHGAEQQQFIQCFPNLKHLLYLGYPHRTSVPSVNTDDKTLPFHQVQTLTLVHVDVEMERLRTAQTSDTQAWTSLTRLVIKDTVLSLKATGSAAWAPNLDLFVSHCSAPLLDAALKTLPSRLRLATFVVPLQDLDPIPSVQLPSTLELLHVLVLVDLGQHGRIAARDPETVDSLQTSLRACAGGAPNLVVKVEAVAKRASETADEVFQEIADRYGLLR